MTDAWREWNNAMAASILLQDYLRAKDEFERNCHSGTIMSDEYERARERAKAALKRYQAAKPSQR